MYKSVNQYDLGDKNTFEQAYGQPMPGRISQIGSATWLKSETRLIAYAQDGLPRTRLDRIAGNGSFPPPDGGR